MRRQTGFAGVDSPRAMRRRMRSDPLSSHLIRLRERSCSHGQVDLKMLTRRPRRTLPTFLTPLTINATQIDESRACPGPQKPQKSVWLPSPNCSGPRWLFIRQTLRKILEEFCRGSRHLELLEWLQPRGHATIMTLRHWRGRFRRHRARYLDRLAYSDGGSTRTYLVPWNGAHSAVSPWGETERTRRTAASRSELAGYRRGETCWERGVAVQRIASELIPNV